MRIVIDGRYIQDRFSGIGRYTYNLIRALGECDSGDTLIIMVNPGQKNSRYDLSALAELPGCVLEHCPIPRFFPLEIAALAPFVRQLKPDVFHSPFFLRPYPLSCPSVLTLYDLIPLESPRSTENIIHTWLFWAGIHIGCRTSSIITTSCESAEGIKKRLRLPPERIHVIPLAPDPVFYQTKPETIHSMREEFSLGGPYVLYVGDRRPHKNLNGLIKAWAHFKKISPRHDYPHTLVLSGLEEDKGSEDGKLIKELHLEKEIIYLGHVREEMLPPLYRGADLFVLPSYVEGYGFPAIEAMASGTAVICSDIPALKELAAGAAMFFQPDDVSQLAEAVYQCLGDEKLRQLLVRKGKIRSKQVNWRDVSGKTLQVYHNLVQS